jgi:hypothetical protein
MAIASVDIPIRQRSAPSEHPAGVIATERIVGDMISYQNDGKYSTADSRKAGKS